MVLLQEKEFPKLCQHQLTGRPLSSDLLIDKLETLFGKQFRKKMIGAKSSWENMETWII